MNLFTDYRAVTNRAAVGPLYDGLSQVEEKVFQKDRARMKLKAIPPHRRRVLYGLEKELDPNLQQLMRDDPRAYYQDDRKLVGAHAAVIDMSRHRRPETVAANANDLLNHDPDVFKHKGDGVIKVKKTGTYAGARMEAGDILVPVPGGQLRNLGAVKNRVKRTVQGEGVKLLVDRTDARLGYYDTTSQVNGVGVPAAGNYPVNAPGV